MLPHTKLSLILEILKYFNYGCFAESMTRKPKIGNLTNMTEIYPFLVSKMWHLLGFVVTCRHMKTKNIGFQFLGKQLTVHMGNNNR